MDGGYTRRGERVARLAAARGRRRPAQLQIMYGVGGRAAADRVRARLAAGLRGLDAGARRQRRAPAAPARRVRRGDRRAAPGAAAWASTEDPNAWAVQTRDARVPRDGLARARRRDLGDPRRAPALHALEGDGVGRVRPRGQGGRAVRPRRARSTLARAPRRDPRARSARGASTPSATPSPSTTAPTRSTRAC